MILMPGHASIALSAVLCGIRHQATGGFQFREPPRMLFFNYHFYVNKSSMVSCTCAIAEWAVGRIPNVVIKVGKMP